MIGRAPSPGRLAGNATRRARLGKAYLGAEVGIARPRARPAALA